MMRVLAKEKTEVQKINEKVKRNQKEWEWWKKVCHESP